MGQDLDAAYWSQRYLGKQTGWDVGAISTPLKDYADQLTNKEIRILIPGAGNAYEAEYLADLGFPNVYVCDLASEPLQNLLKRRPDFNSSHLLQQDFFLLEDTRFDLVLEQTFFCALRPSLRQAYFDKMARLLKPGGRLVGLLFDDDLNQEGPPFGGHKAEYLRYIPGAFRIHSFAPCYNSIKPRQGRELFMNLQKQSTL